MKVEALKTVPMGAVADIPPLSPANGFAPQRTLWVAAGTAETVLPSQKPNQI
jgi:hypothetical protein